MTPITDCHTGKPGYSYRMAAEKAKRATRHYDRPLTEYRCPDCGAWHVGSHTHKPQPLRLIHRFHELRLT